MKISLKKTIYSEPVKRFNESGEITLDMYQNHLDENVLGTTRYLDDMDLLILMEMDAKEAFAPLTRVQKFIIILAPICIFIHHRRCIFIIYTIITPYNQGDKSCKKDCFGRPERQTYYFEKR